MPTKSHLPEFLFISNRIYLLDLTFHPCAFAKLTIF